jgi:cobalt/nickel transport system permease protein
MHISDGILSPVWIVIWYIVAFIFLSLGVREIKRKSGQNPVYMPMLALMGAAIFVISVWHIPVPVTGSCSHPTGTPMSAVLVGPFATVVLSAIALFFQMFLAHGGLTTIGANTVSMGIVGAFSGFIIYASLRKVGVSFWISAGIAAFIGDILTYVTTALQLALSLHPEAIAKYWVIFTLSFVPTQVPLAVLEFAFTIAAIKYVLQRRPEFLTEVRTWTGSQRTPSSL